MGLRIYLLLVYLLTKKDTVTSLSLSCIAGIIEVVEGRQKTVTCNGLRAEDTVEWILQTPSDVLNLGSCSTTSAAGVSTCTPSQLAQMTFSRTLGTESVLNIDFTTMNDDSIRFTLGTLKCQIKENGPFAACQIDFVYPPEGNCAVQVLKNVSPWRVQGYCNVTKALSFLGRYSCQWYLEREASEDKLGSSMTITTTAQPGGRYVTGSCEMPANIQFPTTAGSLKYKVAFTPEKNVTTTVDGISEVQRPSQPTVNCDPKPYVPENTSVSCTCHTQSVGIPGGYLKWSKGSRNIINTVINTGIFDVTSLSMVPYILQKTDHNNTQFRCDVVWAENITGSVYTASVAYIERPNLSINSSQNITVMENQVVVFNCQAVGVPVPTLRLIDINANKELTVQTSPMFYKTAAATCENTTIYTCVATNSVTGGQNISANLYVNCKPRSNPPLTTPQELSPVNYRNKTEQQDFTVVAYPSPDNFTFIYLGSNHNLTIPTKAVTDIYLKVTCSSTQLLYVSKCTLTVDNVKFSAAGVYQVTIGNAFGSEAFTFEVNISERPSRPTVSCSPSPYVPENRNITCTCNIQSVGVPGGRLQWSLARNNSFNVLNIGIYYAINLEMLPQKVSLQDHETMQIRCDVDWAEPIFGDTYTVLVGYSPSQSEMKLNQKMDELSVSESETVAFECQADGRPTPIIRLVTQNETRQLGNSISPLLFNLSAVQCEDTGVYICIASNGMGEVKRSVAKLYVKCKPRGISGTISPKQLSAMVFIAHPVEQTFSVIAYPSPNNFTVTFLGSGKNACESEAVVKGVIMNVMYTHTENIYTINVKLTIVNVTSAAAFGFYRIRLSNEYGYGDFVFEIQSPTISIQDEKARYIGIGVGVGVGAMLAVDVIIIVVVWIYRQQVISKCIEKKNTDSSTEMATVSNVFQNNNETSYNMPEDNSSEAYDSIRRNDLGIMSSYARLDQTETVTVSSQEYQNMSTSNHTLQILQLSE